MRRVAAPREVQRLRLWLQPSRVSNDIRCPFSMDLVRHPNLSTLGCRVVTARRRIERPSWNILGIILRLVVRSRHLLHIVRPRRQLKSMLLLLLPDRDHHGFLILKRLICLAIVVELITLGHEEATATSLWTHTLLSTSICWRRLSAFSIYGRSRLRGTDAEGRITNGLIWRLDSLLSAISNRQSWTMFERIYLLAHEPVFLPQSFNLTIVINHLFQLWIFFF